MSRLLGLAVLIGAIVTWALALVSILPLWPAISCTLAVILVSLWRFARSTPAAARLVWHEPRVLLNGAPWVLGLLSLCWLSGSVHSYARNRALISDMNDLVDQLSQLHRQGASEEFRDIRPPLARNLEWLTALRANAPPLSMTYGLFQGEGLFLPLSHAVERSIIRPILDSEMDRLKLVPTSDSEQRALFEALRLHLLLTQPKEVNEPAPYTADWGRWLQTIGSHPPRSWGASPAARRTFWNATVFYGLSVDDPAALPDRKMVQVYRGRLRLPGLDMLSNLETSPDLPAPVTLKALLGDKASHFRLGPAKGSLPGAYTPEGWHRIEDHTRSFDETEGWDWVSKRPDYDRLMKLRDDYRRDYPERWQRFLSNISLNAPRDLKEVRLFLRGQLLERPLEHLWTALRANRPPQNLLDAALKRVRPRVDLSSFKPEPRPSDTGPANVSAGYLDGLLRFGEGHPSGLDQYQTAMSDLLAIVGESGSIDARAVLRAVNVQKVAVLRSIGAVSPSRWEAEFLEHLLLSSMRGIEAVASAHK
jgi:type VI protein secretion system component VasK